MTLPAKAGRSIGVSTVLLLISLFFVTSAKAAPAAPAWSISATSQPTNFIPNSAFNAKGIGPYYVVVATNVGGAGVTGTFTVVNTLPPGVTPAPAKAPSGKYGRQALTTPFTMSCESVAQTVTCTGGPGNVPPGETVRVQIPVKLGPSVTGEITNTATISGGGAANPATVSTVTRVESASAPFGLMSGSNAPQASATDADGSATAQAGSHPYQFSIALTFPSKPADAGSANMLGSGGGVRDVEAKLPPGVAINPAAIVKCKEQELVAGLTGCPDASQLGTVQVLVSINTVNPALRPLYNMVAPPGSPGVFAFEAVEGIYVHLIGRLNSEGRYELAAGANDIPAKVGVMGARTTLWGNPTAPSHDAQRGACLFEFNDPNKLCSTTRKNIPFITLPSACSSSLDVVARADAWETPGLFDERIFQISDLEADPIAVEGCSALSFEPSITLKPGATSTDSPTGLAATLHIPQNEEYEDEAGNIGVSASTLRDAKVSLPAGFSVNPAAANGRAACTATQIGLKTPVGQPDARFSDSPAGCPDSAKIGSVEVESPLLKDEPEPDVQVPHTLPGSIFLAQPFENPFNSLLAIYIAIDDPQTGVVVKLPGEVQANPVNGQLTASFKNNPQLPFEDFRLDFFGGPRASLRTPMTCGSYAAQSELTPWSGTAPVTSSESFPITQGAGGGGCATTPQQLQHQPSFVAGTSSPLAGRFSPFVLHLSRQDGSQELGGLNVKLPQGLTGKLAGTPYCPEAALAAATAKSGHEEQSQPSCPAASQVGTVTVGAGAGSLPLYVQGKAYLAGPYNGEPLSMAILTPAVAGPFDLGVVVVRAALHIDLFSAEITVQSDPLPQILEGIPLDIRSVAVQIDKPDFTLNPTSCEPKSISGEAISTVGQVAPLSNHFQAAGCDKLLFEPRLRISLKGGTQRSDHPALKAVLTYPKKGVYSNIARAQVALPRTQFLDQGNLNNVCIQAELKSRTCPKKSIYGRAKAWTPLLDKPLEGPVYLGVGFGHRLPDLVAELNGQIRVLLHGKVDTSPQGGIRNTFEAAPDAPVTKFVLEMQGGRRKGLIENSENICRKLGKANAKFIAQNGAVSQRQVPIATSCKGKGKGKGKAKRHG